MDYEHEDYHRRLDKAKVNFISLSKLSWPVDAMTLTMTIIKRRRSIKIRGKFTTQPYFVFRSTKFSMYVL